mgnify:CR=1 FL=1
MKKGWKRLVSVLAMVMLLIAVIEPVRATTISELQEQKKQNEDQLKDVNKQIDDYKGAQADIGAQIDELDAEMVALLTDISLIEEAIKTKEEEIALSFKSESESRMPCRTVFAQIQIKLIVLFV